MNIFKCVYESYHRTPIIRVHTDSSSRGAGDPRDGVQRLTDVDIEVWRSIALVQCIILKARQEKQM